MSVPRTTMHEKLEALQREAGISPDVERKELRTGPAVARREELARRPCWKIKRGRQPGAEGKA
jgi:hypothetical protein